MTTLVIDNINVNLLNDTYLPGEIKRINTRSKKVQKFI